MKEIRKRTYYWPKQRYMSFEPPCPIPMSSRCCVVVVCTSGSWHRQGSSRCSRRVGMLSMNVVVENENSFLSSFKVRIHHVISLTCEIQTNTNILQPPLSLMVLSPSPTTASPSLLYRSTLTTKNVKKGLKDDYPRRCCRRLSGHMWIYSFFSSFAFFYTDWLYILICSTDVLEGQGGLGWPVTTWTGFK
jgi:hypothetical protein